MVPWSKQKFSLSIEERSCMYTKSLQSCLTLCDPMDCSSPGSSVHAISHGKWVAMPSSRGSSSLRNRTASLMAPALAGSFFTVVKERSEECKRASQWRNNATKAQERERMPRRAVARDVQNVVSHQEVAGSEAGMRLWEDTYRLGTGDHTLLFIHPFMYSVYHH